MIAVTDADARILWTYGGRVMRRKAETVNFVPAGRWDEASVGTNALAISNRTGESSMVFSAEHYAAMVHNWVCWAAPLHDPVTGEQIGVIDLSTTWDRTHPIGLATARVMARLIETAMPSSQRWGTPRSARLPRRARAGAVAARHRRGVARRPAAAAQPAPDRDPRPADHASRGTDRSSTCTPWCTATSRSPLSTLKAEVSHLRHALGGQLASRPYRLTLPVAHRRRRGARAAPPRRRAGGDRGVRRRPAARHQRPGAGRAGGVPRGQRARGAARRSGPDGGAPLQRAGAVRRRGRSRSAWPPSAPWTTR